MLEYLKIARPEHWLKNIFILFGHLVAWALALNFQWDAKLIGTAILSLIPAFTTYWRSDLPHSRVEFAFGRHRDL